MVFGVFYGFSHQSAISSRDKVLAEKHEYERKQKLIEEAKQKWAEKTQPKKDGGTQSICCFPKHLLTCFFAVITNPDDPKFDLEKYLNTIKA